MKINTMKHWGPGWEAEDAEETEYQVWAPNGDDGNGRKRDHWAACWSANGGWQGDFKKGPTLDSVLDIFPDEIAKRFLLTIGKRYGIL